MTMASRIVVMSKGHVQQIGTPEEIYSNPSNKFVATFIGTPSMNMLGAHYDNGTVTFKDGYSFKVSDEKKDEVKKFFETEIETLKKRIENINYEVELLPHKVDKDKLKNLTQLKLKIVLKNIQLMLNLKLKHIKLFQKLF